MFSSHCFRNYAKRFGTTSLLDKIKATVFDDFLNACEPSSKPHSSAKTCQHISGDDLFAEVALSGQEDSLYEALDYN